MQIGQWCPIIKRKPFRFEAKKLFLKGNEMNDAKKQSETKRNWKIVKLSHNRHEILLILKGQSHDKNGKMRVWGISVGPTKNSDLFLNFYDWPFNSYEFSKFYFCLIKLVLY
jgi:hypothetical protein